MASENSGEGKLVVKRGRMKRINQSDLNTRLHPELDDCMKEDDMEGTTEQRSSLNDANPSKESSRNNENLESKKDDALGTIDNDNEKMDVPIVDIHETVTQTLGSIEFPVDVELAADFEDVAANLDVRYVGSCDTSTRTEDVVTVEALEKNLKARELFDPTKVAEELSGNVRLCDTSIRTEDVVTVDNNNIASEQPEALGENLEARELLDPTRAADDVENSLMEVQANETLQNDTVQAINKLNTVDEEKPEKRRPGRPKMIHLGKAGEQFDPTHIADNETSPNDNDQVVSELNTEKEEKPKKRGRGRPRRTELSNRTPSELREELLKLLPEPGKSEFTKEASQRIRLLLRSEKRLPCPREGCDKFHHHLFGFQYHVIRCGTSKTISVACEQCGIVYASTQGLAYHQRTAHKKENKRDNPLPEQAGQDKPKKGKTKQGNVKYSFRERSKSNRITLDSDEAATKDDEESKYVAEPDNVETGSDSSSEESVSKPSLYSKSWVKYWERLEDKEPVDPKAKAELSNLSAISELLKKKSKLTCPNKCGRCFRVAKHAYKHIKKCKGKKERHLCKLCGKILQSETGMKSHIVLKHRKKVHNSENDEESEFSESEIGTGPRQARPWADHSGKTKAWYDTFLPKTVLTCWRPSLKHWKKLSASELEHYLPVRKVSPIFRIETVGTENMTPEQATEYQLPLFTSALVNSGDKSNVVFNAGGSVWAMDWAPIPVDEENCDQYLAIGCHSDPDQKHLISECYEEKGVLQIWRIPKLENGKGPTEKPEFCLGIVYDYGPLWDIRWRPSGAWDTSSTQVFLTCESCIQPENGDELCRLGILALACADGKLRIFSVPFPCSLVKNNDGEVGKSSENLLYRAIPHVELSPGSLCRKYQNECGAAWTVSWQPIAHGHSKVIASYADGTVAIWDLKTENRILKSTTPNGLTECIFPISHFQAHNSVIRTLAWCPNEPNYIATGGYDKFVKVWDLRHTSQPVSCLGKVFWTYHLTWPLHWPALVFNTDMTDNRKGTRYLDFHKSCREKTVGHSSGCYISHNAAGWDNDCSDWANIVASVDASGVISVNYLTGTLTKRSPKLKKTLFRALVEPVVQRQDQTTSGQDIQNSNASKSTQKEDRFKIVFKDADPLSESSTEEDAMFKDLAYVLPNQLTHTALQKVRWNPNFSSYQWLATAGKFGLVRLCYVEKFKS